MPPAWKELGFRSYDAYIKSRLWWNIRQLVLERDGRCCQVCGSPSKTVHHIDYTNIIMLGQGDQHELITLCEPCHNFVEQSKRLSEKKSLLNKLFGQHSKNTLDEWQVWAKQFNNDIGYSRSQILEQKNNRKKKYKKKSIVLSDKGTREKQKEQPKPEIKSLRDEIDSYIKTHKRKRNKQYRTLVPATDENRKDFITNTVRKYSRKSKKNIRRYLDNHRPLIELLFNHPEASDKLKQTIAEHPYFIKESRKNNDTEQQKRQHRDEEYRKKKQIEQQEIGDILRQQEYQKQKPRKRAALFGKLPLWTGNHKTKSFQGQSPLTKHIKEVKEQKGSRNDT
jgi:hypothetical protein